MKLLSLITCHESHLCFHRLKDEGDTYGEVKDSSAKHDDDGDEEDDDEIDTGPRKSSDANSGAQLQTTVSRPLLVGHC